MASASQRQSSTNRKLAPLLLEICGVPSSIGEVGATPGALLEEFQHHCGDQTGSPVSFTAIPLSEELPEPPSASLLLCLEGAETLPPDRALALVQWLTHTADVVVFAAALPGQLDSHLIHCQATLYWCDLFELCGFKRYDILRQHLLTNELIPWQQRQNIALYARQNSTTERQLREHHSHNFLPPEFELVHHTIITNSLLFQSTTPDPPSFRNLLKELPASVQKSLRHRLSYIGERLSRLRHT